MTLQVGKNTTVGRMKDLLLGDSDPTPLQNKLNEVAETIGKFGTIAAVAIVGVLLIKFVLARLAEGTFNSKIHFRELINYILIGVTAIDLSSAD